MCQSLLGPALFYAQPTNLVREHVAQIVTFRQSGRSGGFCWHPQRMLFWAICIYGVCYSYAVCEHCFFH